MFFDSAHGYSDPGSYGRIGHFVEPMHKEDVTRPGWHILDRPHRNIKFLPTKHAAVRQWQRVPQMVHELVNGAIFQIIGTPMPCQCVSRYRKQIGFCVFYWGIRFPRLNAYQDVLYQIIYSLTLNPPPEIDSQRSYMRAQQARAAPRITLGSWQRNIRRFPLAHAPPLAF